MIQPYMIHLIQRQLVIFIRLSYGMMHPETDFLIGDPGYASSLFLEASPETEKRDLSLTRNVPWINTRYDFFRFNETTSVYDSIGSTNQLIIY